MSDNNRVFAPGCALLIYKPGTAEKVSAFLGAEFGVTEIYDKCCHNTPVLPEGTEIINVCSGCDRRYDTVHKNVTTVSLWSLLAESDFPFPDYGGAEITVHDTCPTRHKTHVHEAVRTLLKRMNFTIIEPEQTGTNGFCCGDSYYPAHKKEDVLARMKKRADSMPAPDVCVYCVSCIKSMKNGGKNPRYILDLLFNEKTEPGETDPEKWHESLNKFIETH